MRSVPPELSHSSVRTISGWAVVKKRLPEFSEYQESQLDIYAHDVCTRGSEVIRVVAATAPGVQTTPTLWLQVLGGQFSEVQIGGEPVYLYPGSGISLSENYIFIHAANRGVYKIHLDTLEKIYLTQTPDVVGNNKCVGLAAVSDTEYYLMQNTYGSAHKISYYVEGTETDIWHGRVYETRDSYELFDAARIGEVDYIAFLAGREARIITRRGGVWSDSRSVYPIDVVDDTFRFTMGGLSVIDGRLVMVGVLARKNYRIKIYTIGPEHFSHGREWYLGPGRWVTRTLNNITIQGHPGKMVQSGDQLYVFGGDGYYYQGQSTALFGSQITEQQAEIGFDVFSWAGELNRPSRIRMEVGPSDTTPLLKPGNTLEVFARINGVEVKLGTFSIDKVEHRETRNGTGLILSARSLAGKNLAAWNSDSSFDYWSQTKQDSKVVELSEVLRGSGEWEEGDEENLIIQSFNEKGFLYSILRSTRNQQVTGEFRCGLASGYGSRYGVAVLYHREAPQEAEERLLKRDSRASDQDCLDSGFFFVADSRDHSLALYHYGEGDWTHLASGPSFDFVDSWHYLKITFHEGRIDCYYRVGPLWVHALSYTVEEHLDPLDPDYLGESPWHDSLDRVGKGAVFVENVTDHAQSYQFDSQSKVIPVEDNSVFPASDIVIVDHELISYNGKSVNRAPLGPLSWVDGRTFRGAPDDNIYGSLNPISLVSVQDTPNASLSTYDHQRISQTLVSPDNLIVDRVELYVQPVGSPPPLTVVLATADYNYGDGAPRENAKLREVNLSPTGTGWVPADMSDLEIMATHMYHLSVSCEGCDASNYYLIYYNDNVERYFYFLYTYDGSSWTYLPNGMMAHRVYASGANPVVFDPSGAEGFEIYFDGEDTSDKDVNYYDGCALVITEGPGAGQVYKVTGYDYTAPYQWVPNNYSDGWENFVGRPGYGSWVNQQYRRVFVDREPSRVFDQTTRAMIVPTLFVDQRGIVFDELGNPLVDKTTIAAHPAGICSIYRDAHAEVRRLVYASGERDWTLAEMIREIAAKANVLQVNEEMRLEETQVGTAGLLDWEGALAGAYECESAIVSFDVTDWGTEGGVGLGVFAPQPEGDPILLDPAFSLPDLMLLVRQDQIEVYQRSDTSWVIKEQFPLSRSVSGEFTVSFQRQNFSVWNNQKLLYHFAWDQPHVESPTFKVGFRIGVVTDNDITVQVRWPELDQRVDNYILDIGESGYGLLVSLIGEKRAYFVDDQDGNMRLFRNYPLVNPGEPLNLRLAGDITRSDLELRTRLRVEGAEVVEWLDPDSLAQHGNLFALIGLREPNNILEAGREAERIGQDLQRTYSQLPFHGPADPRVEPGDIIEISFPEGPRQILVRQLNLEMRLNREEALFDMNIEGEEYAE